MRLRYICVSDTSKLVWALENIRFLCFPLWCQMVVHTKQDGHLLLFIVQFKQTFWLCLRSAQPQRGKVWPEDMGVKKKREREKKSKERKERGRKRWTRRMQGRMQGSRQGNFPWNAETTAWLPEQFYSPVVSHLSHRPSRSGLPYLFCVFIYLVSVSEDVRSQNGAFLR